MKSSISDSRPLSEALHQGTDGNLLFLIELVKFLCSDRVILYEDGRWMWDMAKVNAATGMSSIGRLIKEKYHRLDSKAQELLRVASCLGSTFSVELLSFTETADANEINNILQDLENLGFIYFDKKQCSCRFVHDKVQQTIYQLTPEDVLAQLHLNIGRKLREKIPEVLVAKNVLLISHQISLGLHLIYDPREKQETAELFLLAAQQAALSSSFVTATAFVHLAIRLLSRRHWREQYQLSLQMYNFAAELEYYNGNLRRVDELVESVIQHAASFDDSLVARFTRIYSLGTRDNMQEGLHESLGVLDSLGERLPRKPGILNIVFGLIRCKHILRGKTDDYILSLPQMTDKKKQAAMRLMIFSIVFAFYVSGEHVPLIAFRLIRNTLRHGISPMGKL
jgi:predicted ATPase